MKTINLLPGWYTTQRRRQRNLRLHVVAMVLIGGVMAVANEVGRLQVAKLEGRRDALAGQLSKLPDPGPELRHLQSDFRRLEELLLARNELGHAVPMSEVIQQLQNAMTPGMALSNLGVDVKSEPVKGSGVVGDPKNPPRYRDIAKLTVMGIAPDNDQIAKFIGRVSKNPLFADVTLDFTRTDKLHDYTVRKFEIQLNMDLEELTSQDPDAEPGAAAMPLVSGGLIRDE